MNPWRLCRCGHSMLLHDVADMDGTDPTCCVEGCDQQACREAGPAWSGVIPRSHIDEDGTRVIDEVRLYGVAPEIFP